MKKSKENLQHGNRSRFKYHVWSERNSRVSRIGNREHSVLLRCIEMTRILRIKKISTLRAVDNA